MHKKVTVISQIGSFQLDQNKLQTEILKQHNFNLYSFITIIYYPSFRSEKNMEVFVERLDRMVCHPVDKLLES